MIKFFKNNSSETNVKVLNLKNDTKNKYTEQFSPVSLLDK